VRSRRDGRHRTLGNRSPSEVISIRLAYEALGHRSIVGGLLLLGSIVSAALASAIRNAKRGPDDRPRVRQFDQFSRQRKPSAPRSAVR
jgi:hypothetical protein